MKKINLENVNYISVDIVSDLIKININNYSKKNIKFLEMDFTKKSKLPKVDLIIARDVLVHLSYSLIFSSLRNIIMSDSLFLLTTSFPSRSENYEIKTGGWRPLNLEITPFNFGLPFLSLNEGCTEGKGTFRDKSLNLYKISELKSILEN